LPSVPALAWLGRHGGTVIAIAVFVGLAVPPLASLLRPLLVAAIVGPFLIALLRIDWQQLGRLIRRPAGTLIALAWLLVLLPIITHALLLPFALPPSLHASMVLMAAAPPLMASGNLALLLGLDATLAVLLTVLATALMPLTLPWIGLHLLGVALDMSASELTTRLGLVIGGCFAAAWVLRRTLQPGFVQRHAETLDGLAIVGLVVFAIAIMDGVSAMLLARPGFVLGYMVAAYALNVGLQALGSGAFAWAGRRRALTMGLCSGNANLGLLLAALADRAPLDLLVFIAAAQLPIYTLPVIQRPFYRRWLANTAALRQPGLRG
jgi:BASS family bile acid:Na+ symporter